MVEKAIPVQLMVPGHNVDVCYRHPADEITLAGDYVRVKGGLCKVTGASGAHRTLGPPVEEVKPNIEQVFAAFQAFQRDTAKGYSCHSAARDRFKARLTTLGLADMIDWTDLEGS